MTSIFHLADPDDWAQALAAGSYEVSTRGRSLAQEGFIHCSSADQVPQVRSAFYADISTPLVLLEIDPERLTSPLVVEVGNPQTGEEFPHIYGPLNPDAVIAMRNLMPPHAAGPKIPA